MLPVRGRCTIDGDQRAHLVVEEADLARSGREVDLDAERHALPKNSALVEATDLPGNEPTVVVLAAHAAADGGERVDDAEPVVTCERNRRGRELVQRHAPPDHSYDVVGPLARAVGDDVVS
ncbi:MAG: hypothetical protein M3256_26550 [Actinomycetota bacterium]|nr:hypothetical protein [Actinomycetota bacterium]